MLFASRQSRVILLLALGVIILSQREQFNMLKLFTQILLYLALAYNAECLVNGKCNVWAWLSVIFPLVSAIGYLFFVNYIDIRSPLRIPVPRTFARNNTGAPNQEE